MQKSLGADRIPRGDGAGDSSSSAASEALLEVPASAAAEGRPRAWAFFARMLGSRRAPAAIVAIGVLLTSSALTLDFTGDDHLHTLMLRGAHELAGVSHRTLNLFVFASGKPEETRALMDEGVYPWWTDRQIVLAFFRPLSGLTHWIDHQLWADQALPMHLHSLLWYALLLVVLARVQRRFAPAPWIGNLALLLYAVDDARATPVGWLSNRNALIAGIPPLLALLAHDRARKRGDRWSALVATLWFAIGLFSGEASVPMAAYLVAYAICLDPDARARRLRSLAPYAGLFLIVRAVAAGMGFGARGSGLYLDPENDPWGFVLGVVTRFPVLLLGQFSLPWSDFWDVLPTVSDGHAQRDMLLWASIVIAGMSALIAPLWRRDPLVRFWTVGVLLATLPVCAAVPNDRLLVAPGVGGAALLARLFAALADGSYPRPNLAVRSSVRALVGVHLVFSPLILPLRTRWVDGMETIMTRADHSIPSDASVTEHEVVVLNPPVDPLADYFAPARAARGIPRPKYFRWLATGVSELYVERSDAYTLKVRPQRGFLSDASQWMCRNPRKASYVGETIALADATFVVTALTSDRRPAEVDVRFHEPLESPHLLWFEWGVHGYVPFRLPAIGESRVIPRVDMKHALFTLDPQRPDRVDVGSR